jgi:hypothetical protein
MRDRARVGRVHLSEAVREQVLTGLGKPGEDARRTR